MSSRRLGELSGSSRESGSSELGVVQSRGHCYQQLDQHHHDCKAYQPIDRAEVQLQTHALS